MLKKILTTGLFSLFLYFMAFSQENDTGKINQEDLDDIEYQLQKIQDSLNRIKEKRLIKTYNINIKDKKSGKTLNDVYLRSKPDKTSETKTMIPNGTNLEVFNYLPDKVCWVVRYNEVFGFLGTESILVTSNTTEIKGSEYDTKPKLKTYVKPTYPKDARKNKIEGKVILKVFINKSGSISEAVILQGIPELNNAAKNAAMQYKFKPAELNGEPVDVWFPLGITFKL